MNLNRKAFLDMISFAEGTDRIGINNGYDVIVGGSIFAGWSDHPRKLVDLGHGLKSTAAGRYQLLSRYFDYYKRVLGLSDFSPASQDAIAIQQIKECKALQDVDSGRFKAAIYKCRKIWASLPGAGYDQREESMEKLIAAYRKAGGTLA